MQFALMVVCAYGREYFDGYIGGFSSSFSRLVSSNIERLEGCCSPLMGFVHSSVSTDYGYNILERVFGLCKVSVPN